MIVIFTKKKIFFYYFDNDSEKIVITKTNSNHELNMFNQSFIVKMF